MNMIEKIINKERVFQILFDRVDFYNQDVKNILMNYIDKYIEFKNLNSYDLKLHYEHFIKQFNKDAKQYINTNIYPALNNDKKYEITREEYDVALLLSTILTQPRYDIMTNIYKESKPLESALVVGSGVGIELALIKNNYKSISAYDIEVDKFCNNVHKGIQFFEEEFTGNTTNKYDDIYIIELLEHVPNPYKLIKNTKNSLNKSGRIIITLAVDIPQFDHVFNFDDIDDFKKEIDNLDLQVEYEKEIKHQYIMNGLDSSKNIFMVLKEKN